MISENKKTIKEILEMPINSFEELYSLINELNPVEKRKLLVALKTRAQEEKQNNIERNRRGR